jgi:hypothetical protein
VFAYPVDKEQELKVERAAGRLGGLTKQKNKLLIALPAEELPTLQGMPLPEQVATLQAFLLPEITRVWPQDAGSRKRYPTM